MTNPAIPVWALQRINTVIGGEHRSGRSLASAADLARRTGLSKRMVRRCLIHVRRTDGIVSTFPRNATMQKNRG